MFASVGATGTGGYRVVDDSRREFLPDADENEVPAEVTDVVNDTDEPR